MPTPSLTLVAYTHFGARGLKGIGMYHLAKEAWRRGWVRKVVAVSKSRCAYDFDLRLIDTLPGESRLISGLGKMKEKVWKAFPARWLSEMIFDRYAASRLTGPGEVLIATPRMAHTARTAKALGYTTMLYGGACDPRYMLQEIATERRMFTLQNNGDNGSRSWEMARFADHLEYSDYIVTGSEFAAGTYVQYGFPKERIFVAPLGVDLTRFSATPPPTEHCITYLFVAHVDGTTGILKGLPYLLQAWCELKLEKAKLLVCGKIGQEVQGLIQRYQEQLHNVEFTGPVSNIAEYYRQASVFIFPSLAEGFGKVVLEAMASGRPVITTPILTCVVRDGIDGLVFPPRDGQALKDKMLHFYNHRDEIARAGANASQQARRFTWDRYSRQIADIVAEVAATTEKRS